MEMSQEKTKMEEETKVRKIPNEDIEIVMQQTLCNRERAIIALLNYDNDVLNAIMYLTE